MGRAYNSLVQEMRVIDDKNYAALKAELKKELIAMMNTADGRCLFYSITPSLTSVLRNLQYSTHSSSSTTALSVSQLVGERVSSMNFQNAL